MKHFNTFNEFINEANDQKYEVWKIVNGQKKELIKGSLEDIRLQYSKMLDYAGNENPKTIEELIDLVNKGVQIKSKGKKDVKLELKK